MYIYGLGLALVSLLFQVHPPVFNIHISDTELLYQINTLVVNGVIRNYHIEHMNYYKTLYSNYRYTFQPYIVERLPFLYSDNILYDPLVYIPEVYIKITQSFLKRDFENLTIGELRQILPSFIFYTFCSLVFFFGLSYYNRFLKYCIDVVNHRHTHIMRIQIRKNIQRQIGGPLGLFICVYNATDEKQVELDNAIRELAGEIRELRNFHKSLQN